MPSTIILIDQKEKKEDEQKKNVIFT